MQEFIGKQVEVIAESINYRGISKEVDFLFFYVNLYLMR